MKKLYLMVVLGLLLSGCASIEDSEFAKHSYSFKSMEHMRFSLHGYQNPNDETRSNSQKEEWWGIAVD